MEATPGSQVWMFGVLAAAIVAQWGLMVWFIHTGRKDARADRKRCEDQNGKLSEEIKAVRDQQTGELAAALRTSAVALHSASEASHANNREAVETRAVLNRVCEAIETLPCARDVAERPPRSAETDDATPKPTPALVPHRNTA